MLMDNGTFAIVLAAAVAVVGLFILYKFKTTNKKAR